QKIKLQIISFSNFSLFKLSFECYAKLEFLLRWYVKLMLSFNNTLRNLKSKKNT
ncbi:MAG: hypothetical protein ACJA1B_001125, partial [Polaribacter sp.]